MNLDKRLLRQGFAGSTRAARAARVDLFLTVGLGLLAGILLVLQARFLSRLVNRVFLGGGGLADVWSPLIALLVLALVRAGLNWAGQLFANRVAGRVKRELRERLSAHLLQLGPSYARGERSGELSNTITEGIEALDAYLSQYLPQLALAALVPLTILIFVFPLDPLSGVILLLTAPLIPVFMNLIGGLADSLSRRQWVSLGRMSAHFLDVLQGLTTLKLLGRSREQIQVIAQVSDRFRQMTMGVLRVAFLSALVLEMLATISTAIVAVQIGLRLLYGHLDFEQAFFVLLLAPEFYLPLRSLGARFHAGMSGVAAAQRIFEILEIKPPLQPGSSMGEGALAAVTGGENARAIRLANVSFAYDDGQRPALRDLSLDILPGQKIALVGPSGSGKSTVAHLLLRFIEPDRGTITINGVPLDEIPAPAWRAQLAWVPQNPYLFHSTVSENLRLARPEATREEVIRAARQAHAHDFIQALPQNYKTLVGERGTRLSGGQAQRIALARAFLAVQNWTALGRDVPLFILDEATANLGPEHERLIQASIEQLLRGRTALIIAHRLATVTRADRILVMDAGRIVEAGTHQALLQQDGLYRRLVMARDWQKGLA